MDSMKNMTSIHPETNSREKQKSYSCKYKLLYDLPNSMIQMLRNLLRPLFQDEIQQLQDELMKSYKAHWDEQERHQTCEQLLEESLRRINELEKHVSIYEHAEKFSKSTPDILRERMLSLSNEAIDIICEYLLFYKTDYILSNHKIKMEKNTNEYIR